MKRRRKKKDGKSKAIAIIGFVFLLAVLWVWKSIEAHKLSRELTGLENAKNTLVENNKHLKAELEKFKSIAYVDSCVRTKYGMTYNVKQRMVLFDSSLKKPKVNRNMFADIYNFLIDGVKGILE